MKRPVRLLAAVTFAAIAAMCQDIPKPKPVQEKRLEQVKWDVHEQRLIITASAGLSDPVTGKYTAKRLIDYVLQLETGQIVSEGNEEHFSAYEGALIKRVLDTIVLYCAESAMWFDSMLDEKTPKQQAKQ